MPGRLEDMAGQTPALHAGITALQRQLIDELAKGPLPIFALLMLLMVTTLPTTRVYLNDLPLQWVAHEIKSLLMVQLFTYKSFNLLLGPEEGNTKAEPEGQDYSGIASRSTRSAFSLALALVLCSLSPLITMLGFINILACRLVYEYLSTVVEIRKPGQ